MKRTRLSGAIGLLLVAGVGLSTTACSSNDDKPAADGKVTITVNGLPPATEALKHKKFLDDVAEFEKLNPNIGIEAREGKMDPQTFTAKLAGGQLEDVFYVYFTDPASLIAKHQVADITRYANELAVTKQIKPELLKVFSDDGGKIYGLPAKNYSMGLLYNRALFTRAGLDPNTPPRTWTGVRDAAKKIAALGDGTVGYGDYSKSNTGGWHFTAELYSVGGSIATKNGGTWKAAFNDARGKQVLQQLKDMRWTDDSMGSRQLLEWADLLQMMGSGKLGMYVATGDNIPTIVNQYKGDYRDYGLAAIPEGKGTLAGGEGYMFNAKASPAKIKAGLKWLEFEFTSPERSIKDIRFDAENKQPVGLPEPSLWTGDAAKQQTDATRQSQNVPVDNYAPFTTGNASVPLKLEPPNAQQIYAVLDVAMQKVLTDQSANVDQLLSDAEKQVNSILATVG
jgi:ABC-type glycerol-3-phosphate transport system substrate-binding protein